MKKKQIVSTLNLVVFIQEIALYFIEIFHLSTSLLFLIYLKKGKKIEKNLKLNEELIYK
jgi:hypothetical protein